jgi:hypothetical protein
MTKLRSATIRTDRIGIFTAVVLSFVGTQAGLSQELHHTPDLETTIFEESFSSELAEGWNWLRPNPARWCIRNGALEIRVMPGLADSVENALLRSLPKLEPNQAFAIELTMENLHEISNQYEQAGLTWYVDDRPVFKFVKEMVDGEILMIPGKVPVTGNWVQLRWEVTGEDYVARFRSDPKDNFQEAAQGKIPRGAREQISLQCYHGPKNAEHWFRFDDFRIKPLKPVD